MKKLTKAEVDDLVVTRIVQVLNRAIKKDPSAMKLLCDYRVYCNEVLAKDHSIQVGKVEAIRFAGEWVPQVGGKVGLIGILAGVAGVWPSGYAKIAAQYTTECEKCGTEQNNRVGSPCPICQTPLVLGYLVKFVKTRKE